MLTSRFKIFLFTTENNFYDNFLRFLVRWISVINSYCSTFKFPYQHVHQGYFHIYEVVLNYFNNSRLKNNCSFICFLPFSNLWSISISFYAINQFEMKTKRELWWKLCFNYSDLIVVIKLLIMTSADRKIWR